MYTSPPALRNVYRFGEDSFWWCTFMSAFPTSKSDSCFFQKQQLPCGRHDTTLSYYHILELSDFDQCLGVFPLCKLAVLDFRR